MKPSSLTITILKIRNALHALAPDFMDRLESLRAANFYRDIIRKHGFQLPLPPFIKRSILKSVFRRHGCRALVETGTQYGDTPWQFRNELSEIYTIELSPGLAALARGRFSRLPQIRVVEGDSGLMIRDVVPRLTVKTLFWLDGHYSAGLTAQGDLDCPVYNEIASIFELAKVPFVILIDDARCFGSDKDYPTIEALTEFVTKICPSAAVTVAYDMISIVPVS
jgi:hypothetical protein